MLKRFGVGLRGIAGFTMVELMIVIAIIGIIAVAVLSAINPIEQINKGRDTTTRSDASEMLNALERMYATDMKYPFYDSTAGNVWAAGDVQTEAAASGVAETSTKMAQDLIAQSELKSGFDARVMPGVKGTPNSMFVFKGDTADKLFVCFLPSSNEFRREANTKCIAGSATKTNYDFSKNAGNAVEICNVAVANAAAVDAAAFGNLDCMP